MSYCEALNIFVMGAHIMKSHVDGQFIREVENEFNKVYPFLKIEIAKRNGGRADTPGYAGGDIELLRSKAANLLQQEVPITDDMKVSELEAALQTVFAAPIQIFRKSGNFWIETKMTRDWTLKQQNDYGRELL
jgi:hypothetical protein